MLFRSQELYCISQSSDDFHDVVNKTLRHATSIANELKSEIREVISQVEQGIDPDGLRERSSSVNAKDKRFDRFRRTRTLSGHLMNSNIKRNDSDKSELSQSAESQEATCTDASTSTETPEKQTPAESPTKLKKVKDPKGGARWHCPPKNIFKPTLQVSGLRKIRVSVINTARWNK